MKNLLLTIMLFTNICMVLGQNNIIVKRTMLDENSSDIDTLVGLKNKKVVFEFDTVYLINEAGIEEYIYCVKKLQECKKLSDPVNALSSNLLSIQVNIDSVYRNTRSLATFIKDYETKTSSKLTLLETDNNKLSSNLITVQRELEEARQKIKNERWNSLGSKLLWGSGGVVVGALIFTLASVLN